MRRTILATVLVVVILFAIGGGLFFYFYNNYLYYSTDDAQVSGAIVNVSATASGQLQTLKVNVGDQVTAGETIGTIVGAPAASATPGTAPVATRVNVTSPISGTIVQVPSVKGQVVAPGLTLVQVTDLNNTSITAYVDESQIDNVKTGQQVDIKVDAYSDTKFTGHVQQIVQATAGSFSLLPSQDNASGNFTKVAQRVPVIITLDGSAGKNLLPGMSSEVTIHVH